MYIKDDEGRKMNNTKPNHIEPLLTDCKPSRKQDSYYTLVHKINEIIVALNELNAEVRINHVANIEDAFQMISVLKNQSKNTFDAIVDDEPYMPLEDVKKIVELQNHPASPTIKFDTPTAAPQQSNDLPTEECWEASGGGCPATVREEFLRAENTRLKETIQEAHTMLIDHDCDDFIGCCSTECCKCEKVIDLLSNALNDTNKKGE